MGLRAVLRGEFTALNVYIRKKEKSQINNLSSHPRKLKRKKNKLKVGKRKEITKIRVKIYKI